MSGVETNLNRIIKEIELFSNFNSTPGKGVTRFSYSDADKEAKNYLRQQFESLDLEVTIDAVGNIRAKRKGTDVNAPTVMTGSHIDTVLYGGKFDGVVGVAGASAAAEIISQVDTIVTQKANATTVGTVGSIICEPNVANIIPAKVLFTLDVRDVDPKGIDIAVSEIERLLDSTARKHGVKKQMTLVAEAAPIKLADDIIGIIEEEAKRRGIKYKLMNSGAVHDSSLLAGVTSVGMIFVPSVNGRSHVQYEKTDFEDIKQGCDLLLGAIYKLSS